MVSRRLEELNLVPRSRQPFVPPVVQREADLLAKETGTAPVIEHQSSTVICVVHETGRLRLEQRFRRGSSGWKRGTTTFFEDGIPVQLPSWGEYLERYEELTGDPLPVAGEMTKLSPWPQALVVPQKMQLLVSDVEKIIDGREGVTITLGRDTKRHSVVVVTTERGELHFRFEVMRRSGKLQCAPCATAAVIVMTKDKGVRVFQRMDSLGSLREALALVLPEV